MIDEKAATKRRREQGKEWALGLGGPGDSNTTQRYSTWGTGRDLG